MALFADRFLRFPEHDRYVIGARSSLLWPVYVWRILYPEPSRNDVNVFQEAILGLARAKTTDPAMVGSLLRLDPRLIAFIVGTELLPRGLMDGKGITDKGLQALETLEHAKSRQLVGYAFQDVITGELLPRFSTSLPEIEPSALKEGYPEFVLDRGKGRSDCPFCVPASNSAVIPLGEGDFFDAYTRYRRDYDNARQLYDDDSVVAERVRMYGIELIDESPVRMYLWFWLFKDKGSDKQWLASDPFGLRKASPWMRNRVSNLALKSPTLAKRLIGLLGLNPNEKLTPETLDEMDEQVMWEVLSEYDWASRVPQLRRYLPAFMRQNKLVELRTKPTEEQLDSLLSEAQKLAEGTLQWMLEQWPVFSNQRLPKSKEWSSRSEAIISFKSLNIPAINDFVADGLAGQQPWMIKKARNHRNQSLKALLAAALFSCSELPEHPLNNVDLSYYDLQKIIELAEARNKAGHASGKTLSKNEALSISKFVLEWTIKFKEWY